MDEAPGTSKQWKERITPMDALQMIQAIDTDESGSDKGSESSNEEDQQILEDLESESESDDNEEQDAGYPLRMLQKPLMMVMRMNQR